MQVCLAADTNPILAQDAAFLAACRGEQPAQVTIPEVLPTLAVLQAVANDADWRPTPEEVAAAAAETALGPMGGWSGAAD